MPVTVLTGFLGAGKTTLLLRLLDDPGLRAGVILNELGQAGTESLRAGLLELTEGCVCCTANPDLIAALAELWNRGDVDRVVIETTGLANPLSLTFTLERPDLAHMIRLDAVVTVVDAANFEGAQTVEWEEQVRAADLVLLTKTDLAAPDAAITAVRALNGAARISLAAEVPPSLFWDLEAVPGTRRAAPIGTHTGWDMISLAGGRYRLEPTEDLLETLPEEVFRAKGMLHLEDGSWAAFHVVAGRLQLELGVTAPPHGESRVVLFGKTLDGAGLESLFAACRVL
jgi:G3E family GTPase